MGNWLAFPTDNRCKNTIRAVMKGSFHRSAESPERAASWARCGAAARKQTHLSRGKMETFIRWFLIWDAEKRVMKERKMVALCTLAVGRSPSDD